MFGINILYAKISRNSWKLGIASRYRRGYCGRNLLRFWGKLLPPSSE